VVQELQDGDHCKTSVLELLGLALFEHFRGKVRNTDIVPPETIVVNKTDDGEQLGQANRREGEDGINTVRNIREHGSVEVDGSRPAEELGDNVSEDSKHRDTAVLELNRTPAGELFGGGFVRKAKGIEETSRGDHTGLILVGRCAQDGGGHRLGGGGECGGSAGKEGSKDELHGGYFFDVLVDESGNKVYEGKKIAGC
jgi:hypothetical protein